MRTAAAPLITRRRFDVRRVLSKARHTRVSSMQTVWVLLVRSSSPLWHTQAAIRNARHASGLACATQYGGAVQSPEAGSPAE